MMVWVAQQTNGGIFGLREGEIFVIAAGIVLLVVVLLVALLATLWVRGKGKEKKHTELLEAAAGGTAERTPTAEARLLELDKLREAGALSDEEYKSKRRQIIDSL